MNAPRIVVARPDHIGDVLLTLPAVAALKRALPRSSLTYLASEAAADVARHCPYVDETLTASFPSVADRWHPGGWERASRGPRRRLEEAFDMAVLFRPDDPWCASLVASARVPIRIGFDQPRTHPFLTHVVVEDRRMHVAENALELARNAAVALGARSRDDAWPDDLFVPMPDEEAGAGVPAYAGVHPIVLHPGSSWPLKNWPGQRWAELAVALRHHSGLVPLVLGSGAEARLIEPIVRTSGGAAATIRPPPSLGALAALHRRASLVVATDNGALHLAALMGSPVIGLYGPVDDAQFGPRGRSERRVLKVELPCRPCGTLVDPPCGARSAPRCVTGIDVATVLDQCLQVLAA